MSDREQAAGLRRFMPEELAQYDGKDGRPAYVAYRGRVYDVSQSRLWRDGVHVRAHSAGEDLSEAMMAAPHDDDVMARMPVVGELAEEGAAGEALPPWWAQLSLDHHLHPIAVHFPTALGAVAPLFALISLFFIGNRPVFETFQAVAFWNLVICAVATVPAIATGITSWYYNYAAVMTPIYRIKWGGSIVLAVLAIAALSVRLLAVDGIDPGGAPFWVYMVLLLLHAPTVVVLGHYGGKITFPS